MNKPLEKGPLAGYKVQIAPRNKIRSHPEQVRRVMAAIGYPRALVTDESSVADFGFDDPDELTALTTELGVPVEKWDRIWEAAERLYIATTDKQ